MTTITVTSLSNLNKELERTREHVLAALEEHDVVMVAEDFVGVDLMVTGFDPFETSDHVFPIEIGGKTDKGLLVVQNGVEKWVGKSVVRVYELDGNVTVDDVRDQSGQERLAAYAAGGGE